MHNSLAKKIFAVGSSVAMLLGALAPAFAVAAVHADGTNVSSNGTVYFIVNGQKRPYTSAGAFLSYGFNSWSNVVAASAEDLALPTGAFVPPADGSLINDNGTVYLITNGQRAGFTSAANFLGLGYSWANVIPGDTSFMSTGALINTTAMAHPVGTLVNQSGTVYLMTSGGKMGIPSLSVFNSWGYSFGKTVAANSYDNAIAMNSGIMPSRVAGQLSPAVNGTVTPTPTGSVTASLASDNPAAGTIVAGQALADLAHFTFSGTGTISALTFQRIGVSANSTPANVYLFNGSTRVTDAGSVGSTGAVNFSGLSLAVNGSLTLAVKSDIASSTSGQTVGMSLTSYTVGTPTSVSISGNLMTIASATLATVAMSAATGSGNTDPGTDISVWQGTATVGTRDVTMTRLALRQIGSIVSSDIKNFRLYVDGAAAGSAVANVDSNGYVTFTPNVTLKSGARTIKVLADVIGGSGRTVQMSLRGAYDISTTDTSYGVGVLATGSFPFGPSSFTVNAGTLTVAKASDSPSTNLVVGASDVAVAKFNFTAYGEAIKVDTLTVGADVTTTGADNTVTFRNVRVMVDGAQVGSTTDVAAVDSYASGQSFTTNFTVNPGTPRVVEIRADMVDNEGTDEINTAAVTAAQFALVTGSTNGTPQVSLTPINVPTAAKAANNLTIASGTISLAATSNYPSQVIAPNQTGFKLGSFTLTGNASEAVNINSFTLSVTVVDNSGAPAGTFADVTDVYLKYGSTTSSVKPTVAATGNTWSPSFNLGVNESIVIDVYGTLGSDLLATDTVQTSLLVAGTTAQSGAAVSTNSGVVLAGQTMTLAAGTITATLDASAPVAQLVDDSGTVTSAAFKFAAVTDSYTVTDITVTIPAAGTTAIAGVVLKDHSTGAVVGASKPAAATLTWSGLTYAVPANTNKVLDVVLTMSTVGYNAGTSDADLTTAISAATARNSGGTSAAVSGLGSPVSGNAMYAYKAVPLLTQVALPNADLAAGSNIVLAKFTVSSNGTGELAWKQLLLEISKTATPVITVPTLWDADAGTQVTAAAVFQNTTDTTTACDADSVACELLITVGTNANDDTVQQISGAKTYEVRGTIAGAIAATDNVSVKFDRNSATHVAKGLEQAIDNSLAANNVSFVWTDGSDSAGLSDTGVAQWVTDYLVKNLPLSWNLN